MYHGASGGRERIRMFPYIPLKKTHMCNIEETDMSSRAILFGIDYVKSSIPLRGCSNDVKNMGEYLTDTLDYATVDIYTEQDTPEEVTGHGILNILWGLVVQSHRDGLERVWIHFSGHGTGITDRSGDEQDGQDEAICPVDYATRGVITDDMIKNMIRYFNKETSVVCVFDCCHSGTMGDLKYRMSETGDVTANDLEDTQCWANVTMLSGCRDDQTSADAFNVEGNRQFSGAMTTCLLSCLQYRHRLHGSITAGRILKDVRRLLHSYQFEQVPILTSSRPLKSTTVLPM